jgi:hypothetical protein
VPRKQWDRTGRQRRGRGLTRDAAPRRGTTGAKAFGARYDEAQKAAAKAAPAATRELAMARGENMLLRQQIKVLKAELAAKPKPPKPAPPPLDPDSEVAPAEDGRQPSGNTERSARRVQQADGKQGHDELLDILTDHEGAAP